MEESGKKYLLKVSIDYGSTNTVIMYRLYEKNDDGKYDVSGRMPTNNVKSIPTLIALASENDQLEHDIFGEAAADAQKGTYKPVTHSNFKQNLYMYMSDTPEFAEGKRLAVLFFGHLLEYFRSEIYGRLVSPEIKDNMETCLYLTTPVRAMPLQNAVMLDIAEEAGFTEINGIDKVSIECNEAEAVVRHAFSNSNNSIEKLKAKAIIEGVNVMFVDIGGSTTDMSLQRIYRDKETNKLIFDSLGSWPKPEVKFPLGGCEVDEAIKNYLIKKGYAYKDFTENNWIGGSAKFDFRMFKEANNKRLGEGKRIESLGALDSEIIPKRKAPEVDYDEINDAEKIDKQIFVNEICPDYIDRMTDAVRELIQNQRDTDKPRVDQKDIDAVFIFGAGSNMFFVEDIFMGRLGKNRLELTKIIDDGDMLLNKWDNPSYCCAMGALAESGNSVYNDYADAEYRVRFKIYELGEMATINYKEKNFFLCNSELFGLEDSVEMPAEGNAEPAKLPYHYITTMEYTVAEKNSRLNEANTTTNEKSIAYTDHWGGGIGVKVFFLKEEAGVESAVWPCRVFVVERKPSSGLLRNLLAALGYGLGAIPALIAGILTGNDGEGFFKGVNKVFFNPREQELIMKSNFSLQKNNILSGKLLIDVPGFETFDNEIEIK